MRKRVKKHVPNAITCANLFSGCIGIVFVTLQDNLVFAAYCIFLAAIFDFFDGLASRVLQSFSMIGKDLDSLADVVSFGVLPSFIIYRLFLQAPQIENVSFILNFIAFLIPVFSALRLAKFNNDERQSNSFIGLPTPANAILIASFPLIIQEHTAYFTDFILNPFFLTFFVCLMCMLLVIELPLMSLKFSRRDIHRNIYRYFLLLVSAILILFFKFAAVPAIVVMYIILSIIQIRTLNDKVSG